MTFEDWFERYSDKNNYHSKEELKMLAKQAWEAAQPKWRPIETAPKDNDILLLTKQGDVATGYWGYEDRECTGQWMWFDGEPIQQDVVGWMPKEVLIR